MNEKVNYKILSKNINNGQKLNLIDIKFYNTYRHFCLTNKVNCINNYRVLLTNVLRILVKIINMH